MTSLAELLAKTKQKKASSSVSKTTPQTPQTPQTLKPSVSRDILHGSGVTKRKAVQAEKDQEKLQQQTFHASGLIEKDETGAVLLNVNLPSSLMDQDIQLDSYQQEAVDGLKNQKYGCLIGQAGTGKTTTAKVLISASIKNIPTIDLNTALMENKRKEMPDMNVAVCIVSYMGKAVQQIKRALPAEYHPLCNTIHSTLAYAPVMEPRIHDETGEEYEVKVFRPQFTKNNKLPFQLCIIDEGGTVPIGLFNELVEALPETCKILIMGDLNQLPPPMGRSVLGFAILKWPTFVLSKIHRQKDGSPIIENADRIIHGKKPLKFAQKFTIQQIPDSGFDAFQHATATIQALHKKGLFDPMQDAFIVPQNIDTLGQVAFNEKLVRYFNPTKKIENIPVNPPIVITAGWQSVTFAVGDKVMATANNRELGLTNGMVGVIKEIVPNPKFKGEAVAEQTLADINSNNFTLDLTSLSDELKKAENAEAEEEDSRQRQASHIALVKFQNVDDLIKYSAAGEYTNLVHSYAITCHKAQGSEYPTVVILVHSANLIMLSREWLYTAVTRARKHVILLVNNRGLTQAVNRQLIKGTTIEEKAQKFLTLSKKDSTSLPLLGEPETFK